MNLHPIDISILVLYLVAVIGFGFYMRRKAASSVDDYFLAGRNLHWIYISISGSVSTYDITGTMWICSMFYLMGLKAMWIHWMWGFMMAAFFMTYAAKWARRSKVMTAAEWWSKRFGTGVDGKIVRFLSSLTTLIYCIAMIGYAFVGIKKFAGYYFPEHEQVAALFVIGAASLYVILGGMYSVVLTDVVQTIILTIAAVVVAVICYNNVSYEAIAAKVPEGWFDLSIAWQPEMLAESSYKMFGLFCIVWITKGLLLNASEPSTMYAFQRFSATRTARDACKAGAAWPFFLISRWGMCMGITALAIVGIDGITDTERVLPFVLDTYLGTGIKGFILAGFFAAFMSTFDSTINAGASYWVKDIYQAFINPKANNKSLTTQAYGASLGIVIIGLILGTQLTSIESIWNWINVIFGAGILVPNFLRWYWWRYNAWGMIASMTMGMFVCVIVTIMGIPEYISFFVIFLSSLFAAVVVTCITPPIDQKILVEFYKTVRPGGFWKPVREMAEATEGVDGRAVQREFRIDLVNTGIAMVAMFSLYLIPVYAVIHAWNNAGWATLVFALSTILLAKTWYKNLPTD